MCCVPHRLPEVFSDNVYIFVYRLLSITNIQDSEKRRKGASELPFFKVFKMYLILLGQYSNQTEVSHKINVTVVVCTITSILLPTVAQVHSSLCEGDIDTVLDCVPVVITVLVTLIKIINHNINREKFENIFNRMSELWETAEIDGELQVLKEVIDEGSEMGRLYRSSLWGFTVLFLSIPLFPPVLDHILPLNETRKKLPLFKLNYIIDMKDHFFLVYLHSACCSLGTVLVITTVDSLYMVIIHYSCGLFALCGYQVKKAAESTDVNFDNSGISTVKHERFKRCVITHYEAIKFYEYMEETTRMGYLFQVGLNMINITVTAVQVVANFDRPAEALRITMFLCGQQFHLYALSLPGQTMIDRSLELINDIYFSTWYQIPVQFERMLHIMQIRSSRACKLTAGGLYEMNMENFGMIVKNCMSYFTVLLSFKN